MKGFLQKKINKVKLSYLLILGILFSLFVVLALFNIEVKKEIAQIHILLKPIEFTPGPYPVLLQKQAPEISATGALVIDKGSRAVLYEKNGQLIFPPASTTKIMTALVALDYFNLNDVLSIGNLPQEGSVIGLKVGEKLTFESLLYAMMLPSANDATQAIAQNYPGGETAFVEIMNFKAKELGLSNTYYQDPVGLNPGNYTSSFDLARLTSVALNNPVFSKVVNTKSVLVKTTDGKEYKLNSLNILLGTRGVNGVKTGYTEEAGEVLVTSKRVEGTNRDLILVVMESQDRFGDTQRLLDFLTNNVSFESNRP